MSLASHLSEWHKLKNTSLKKLHLVISVKLKMSNDALLLSLVALIHAFFYANFVLSDSMDKLTMLYVCNVMLCPTYIVQCPIVQCPNPCPLAAQPITNNTGGPES